MAGRQIYTTLFDNGLNVLKAAADAGHLSVYVTEGWVLDDTYTTITTTKSRGYAVVDTADVSNPANDGSSPPNRRVTIQETQIPGGTVLSTSGDLHLAVVNTNSQIVYSVHEETSDQSIVAGNPITVPLFTIGFNQALQA